MYTMASTWGQSNIPPAQAQALPVHSNIINQVSFSDLSPLEAPVSLTYSQFLLPIIPFKFVKHLVLSNNHSSPP